MPYTSSKRVHPTRKLTAPQARAIRLAFAEGKSIKELAAEYGVSESTVWNVVNYETWVSAGPPRRFE
jgi:DNA-binding NarL/FixJ family response regulator